MEDAVEEDDDAVSEEESVDLDTEDEESSAKESNSTTANDNEDVDVQLELVDDPTIDEDSSANVDRMEYADAYDFEEEGEPIADYGSSAASTGSVEWQTTVPIPGDDDAIAAVSEPTTTQEEEGRLPTIPEEVEGGEGMIRLASEISEEMGAVMLNELQYTRADLNVMRPEIASVVVAKRVMRPLEGLPTNWYKDGSAPGAARGMNSRALKLVRKVAIGVLAVAAVVGAGSKVGELELPKISLPKFPKKKKAPPKKTAAPVEDFYQQAFALLEEADPKTYVEDEPEEEEHEHSVRPREKPDKEPLDKTWLDKAITAVERRIKKLFGFRL